MNYSEKFGPEWGNLSSAPSFIYTARVVLAATAIGAIASAGVVLSLAGHSESEASIARHTLVQSSEPFGALPRLPQAKVSEGISETAARGDAAAAAPAPPSAGASPEKTAFEPPLNAAAAPAASPAQVEKRTTKKPDVTDRYAWRGGYYSDNGQWGGYSGDRGWRHRDAW